MKTAISLLTTLTLVSAGALAQDSAAVRGSASAESQGSVSADTSGARASQRSSASGELAGSAAGGSGQGSAALAGGTELNARLDDRLDARKAEPGDEVTATVVQDVESNGRVVIEKGTSLVGRVTAAEPRRRGSESDAEGRSRLGVVFDKAVLGDGREMPVDATIQALAVSRAAASAATRRAGDSRLRGAGRGAGSARGAAGGLAGAGGGIVGGVTGSAGGVVGGAGDIAGRAGSTVRGAAGAGSRITGAASSASAGAVGGFNAAGRLASGSRGVFGLDDIELASAAAGSAQGSGSLITSAGRSVRLSSGTQMLLVTGANAAAR